MMYPRLKLARNLLTDDGVIFISIDDAEQANFKKLCDEVFGEDNFVEVFFWKSIFRPSNMSMRVRSNAEYVLCYARNASCLPEFIERLQDTQGDASLTKNANKVRALKFPTDTVLSNLPDGIYPAGEFGDVILHDELISRGGVIVNDFSISGRFAVSQEYLDAEINKGIELRIKTQSFIPYYRKVYQQSALKPTKILPEDLVGDVLQANADMNKLFSTKYFDYPKPVSLVKFLVGLLIDEKNATVLDFFSGSGTTAHAVMQLNAEDDGNRKHIQVQLPEPTDEKSEAYKAGYRKISDIARERINRAGEKIKTDYADKLAERDVPLDVGYRTYQLADTNFRKWQSTPTNSLDELQTRLELMRESADDNASEEDLLVEVMLKMGLSLTTKIDIRQIEGLTVHQVAPDSEGDSIQAIFYLNEHIKPTLEQLRAVINELPSKFVIIDDAFQGDNQLKTNLVQTCKSFGVELWTV